MNVAAKESTVADLTKETIREGGYLRPIRVEDAGSEQGMPRVRMRPGWGIEWSPEVFSVLCAIIEGLPHGRIINYGEQRITFTWVSGR